MSGGVIPKGRKEVAGLAEALLPWWLHSGGLNQGEEEELARLRSLGAPHLAAQAVTTQPMLRATEPATEGKEKKQMAGNYAAVATKAAKAAAKYAPMVYDKASVALSQVTNGKVRNVQDIPSYVGNNAARLKVASEALLRSGVMLGDVLPRDLIGTDQNLIQIRRSAESLVATLQGQYLRGSDKSLAQGVDAIAADVLRKKRVKAALATFGSKDNYFLCNPNGGIPAEDFAWHEAVSKA